MNKQNIDKLLNHGLSKKEIKTLDSKGFTK